MTKTPPFGKRLFEMRKYANAASMIAVCVGLNAFARARSYNRAQASGFAGLVLPDSAPETYVWPVADAECLIEWDFGPSDIVIGRTALCLHRAGAISVTSWHIGEEREDPGGCDYAFDLDLGRTVRVRHGMHFFQFQQ